MSGGSSFLQRAALAFFRERRTFSRFEAFVDLLEQAAPIGECMASERFLAARWMWSTTKVRAFLRALEQTGELVRSERSTLTLVHFALYTRRVSAAKQPEKQANPAPPREMPRLTSAPEEAKGLDPHPDVDVKLPSQGGAGGHHYLSICEQLVTALNDAQRANPRIDPDTFRPLTVAHRGNREAALAIRNAGVPLPYALEYVRAEGQRYRPKPKAPQIGSLAYLRGGLISSWIRRRTEEERRSRGSGFTTTAAIVAATFSHLTGRDS